jgi:hypothetical protein
MQRALVDVDGSKLQPGKLGRPKKSDKTNEARNEAAVSSIS